MTPIYKRIINTALSSAVILAATSTSSFASLGKLPSEYLNTNTVRSQSLSGNFNQKASTYSVRSSILASGTAVREYVGSDGIVFAVTWSGPFLPDLNELLGDNFTLLKKESVRLPKAGRGQVIVTERDISIESTGRMRAFQGRAWVRSKLADAGLAPENIE
jgi:hypothetical protein